MSPTFVAAVLTAVIAASLHAQADTSSALSSRINGQALIRVSGRWGTRTLVGPRLSGRSLAFEGTELGLDSVDRIQVRGNAAGRGALIGAGIGLAGGLAMGIGLTSSLCNDGLGCRNAGGGSAFIALVSTAGGALLGALIGSTAKRWVTIYPGGGDSGLP
ncbi:MAG TPA: hypothetical protein VKB45_02935 [Gemmatimonadales bacterium]|nr:hypothetical protein [Gemmatimonadales bacterium]